MPPLDGVEVPTRDDVVKASPLVVLTTAQPALEVSLTLPSMMNEPPPTRSSPVGVAAPFIQRIVIRRASKRLDDANGVHDEKISVAVSRSTGGPRVAVAPSLAASPLA